MRIAPPRDKHRSAPAAAALASIVCALALGCGQDEVGEPPLAPIDYSRAEFWLARPGQPSRADETPTGSGLSNLQALAHADVFYVHPTTAMRGDVTNAPIDDPEAVEIARVILQAQATPFNAVARVFAPHYRQITLPTYDLDEEQQQAPNNRAYADVRRAFEHYAAHDNGGRPFFLVGHSQGTNHAQRLLSEAIQGTPMQQRLVAAYLPGQPVPRSVFDEDLTQIPPCTQPDQTGCVAIWGVFEDGAPVDLAGWEQEAYWNTARQRWVRAPGQPMVAINPVSWSVDEPNTDASRHRGAVPFGVAGTNFTRPRGQLVSVRDDGRFVFVTPKLPADLFNDGGIFEAGNYHVFDISLFWLDLRENARRRLNAFLLQGGAKHPLLGATAAVTAKVGQPFRFEIEAANAPASFGAQGLPPDLALDEARGIIEGTPRQAGVYPIVLSASNDGGSDHADLALTVEE